MVSGAAPHSPWHSAPRDALRCHWAVVGIVATVSSLLPSDPRAPNCSWAQHCVRQGFQRSRGMGHAQRVGRDLL